MLSWVQKKFSRKITLLFVFTLCLSMALAGYLILRRVRNQLVGELAVSLDTQSRLILTRVNPHFLTLGPNQVLQKIANESAHASGARVTFIDKEGQVLADSSVPFDQIPSIENHLDRTEVRDALSGQTSHAVRHSHTVDRDLLYGALPVQSPVGVMGVIRLAMDLAQVNEKTNHAKRDVIQLSLIVGGAGLVLLFVVLRSLRSQLDNLADVALNLSRGQFSSRVTSQSKDEFGQFGETLNFLADKIQTTISDLSKDKSHLSSVLSNMVEGVVAVDEQGRITVVNSSLCALFDVKEPTATGRPLLEVFRHSQLQELVQAVLSDGVSRVDEIRTFGRQEKLFEAHAVPLQRDGERVGVLLVLHNITRLRQLEQVRRDFVANVSHELRTPLSSIKGYAETLKMGAMDDHQNRDEFVRSIETHSDQMMHLIDDLLDLSAIESGKRVVNKQRVSMKNLIEDVLKDLKPLADKKNIQLQQSDTADQAMAFGDPVQLRQVLVNLVDNAIKFNREKGRVEISVQQEAGGVQVTVSDTGPGISGDDLPRVFERFFRADKARSRDRGGTGLGLAIVKHIVEAHSGRVSVQSEEGKGSSFRIFLPNA